MASRASDTVRSTRSSKSILKCSSAVMLISNARRGGVNDGFPIALNGCKTFTARPDKELANTPSAVVESVLSALPVVTALHVCDTGSHTVPAGQDELLDGDGYPDGRFGSCEIAPCCVPGIVGMVATYRAQSSNIVRKLPSLP